MRRLLIIIVLALVVGGAVGTLMSRDPGYVLISYAGRSVETSLWFALATLAVVYFALRAVVGIVRALLNSGSGIRAWQQNRRSRNAHERTLHGLLRAGEGDWSAARKTLAAVAPQADVPLVNYLFAARAANELDDAEGRDSLLDRAAATDPSARLTVAIARAEMRIAAHEFDAAAATLNQARVDAPDNRRVLELLVSCYEGEQNWAALLQLADDLQQHRVWSKDALAAAQRRWWSGYFRHRAHSLEGESTERMATLWNEAGKDLRYDPDIVLAQVDAELANNDADAAEATLKEALDAVWSPALVERYGRIRGSDIAQQRDSAEHWLKKHSDDAALRLAAGRLALAAGDAEAAREHLERSVALEPSAQACGELGRLCAERGDHARAAQLLTDAAAMHGDLISR